MKITTRNDFGLLAQEHFKTGMGAEIGVEYGSNSKQILTQYKGKLICVDMWANEEIYKKAMETLSPLQTTIIRKSSIEAANDIDFGSLDFVYIDAGHDFMNFANDLHYWLKKLKIGGIMSGHDYARYPFRKMIHVKRVLEAYAWSYRMLPLFVVGALEYEKGIIRDRYRSWFWVKSEHYE